MGGSTCDRYRHGSAALLLASYPVLPLVLGSRRSEAAPRLPRSVGGLLSAVAVEAALFVVLMAATWALGRPRLRQLGLERPKWTAALLNGALLGFGLVAGLGLLGGAAEWIADRMARLSGPQISRLLHPEVERIVDRAALADPVYLALSVTLVSFGLAGLREELWRAALLASARAFAPRFSRRAGGTAVFVIASAVLFGLGHVAQGPAGVVVTALLGVAFGLILVLRNSLPEAVVAHGVFDALNFVLLAVSARTA